MLIRIRIRIRNPAIFSACYFLKVHLHYFSKIKSQKDSQNSRIHDFSYYFCMMIEGSGSGSIPLTCRSGSGRPKTRGSGGSGFGSGTLQYTNVDPGEQINADPCGSRSETLFHQIFFSRKYVLIR